MKTLEFYVKSEETVRPPPGGSYSDYDAHPCQIKFNIVKMLCPMEKNALEDLSEVAREKGLALRVYDVATMGGRLRALIKGVRTTPTIIIGTRRIEGFPSKESLSEIL